MPQPSQQSETIKKYRDRGDATHKVSEATLLRDITFALSNVEANYIVFEEDHYHLHPEIKVTDTVRRIVRELSDIGWLYHKITESTKEDGVITKALKIAID